MSEESKKTAKDELSFERVLRQGDVILFKLKAAGDAGRSGKSTDELILAYGEVTGHAHRLRGDLEVFPSGESTQPSGGHTNSGRLLFRVLNSATLTHEEHDSIVLEPGFYLKVNQVEFDPFERMIRSVQD